MEEKIREARKRLSNIALEGEHGFREEAIQQGSKRAGEKEM